MTKGKVEGKEKLNSADFVQIKPVHAWKVCVDHPLVLFYHTSRPNQILVESLVEPKQKRVLFELDKIRITACDQFLPSL